MKASLFWRTLAGSINDYAYFIFGWYRRDQCDHPPSEPEPFCTCNDGCMNALTPTWSRTVNGTYRLVIWSPSARIEE